MALKLKQKKSVQTDPEDTPETEAKPKKSGKAKKGKLGGLKKNPGKTAAKETSKPQKVKKSGLLKRGKAAKSALEKERQAAAVRDAQRENEVFRFYMKAEDEKRITFLDGELDEDGDLDGVCYYEHSINNPGQKYPKYVCINDPANGVECPICQSGNQPYFATVFTVLVHDTWHSKKLKKDMEGSIRLFVAKQGAADKLRQKAKKYGGLKGATFDVIRTNADAYNVGDDFDYLQTDDLDEIAKSFPDCCDDDGNLKIPDYDEAIAVFDADELRKLGFGSKSAAVGGEEAVDEDEVL